MTYPTSRGAFAAINRYFDNPHVSEEVLLTVITEGTDEPIQLSLAAAREALHAPNADTKIAAAVWQEALRAARTEATPHGLWRLLAIWLALPRLSGTAYRICDRLRIDRSDVEAEMVLALLERLRTVDPESPSSPQALIRAACGGGWRFALAAARKAVPSTSVENIAEDHHRALTAAPTENSTPQTDSELEIIYPERAAGLNASLRFQASPAQLREKALGNLADRFRSHKVVSQVERFRRRRCTETLPLRHRARRR